MTTLCYVVYDYRFDPIAMNKVIIKNSRLRPVVLLIAAIGFVVAGAWMVSRGKPFGWVAIAFFGSGALVFVWQIVDRRPRLTIDQNGVIDRTLGVGRIVWSDIESAYLTSINGNGFICLELGNPEKYSKKMSKTRRAMSTVNRNLGFTDFCINLSGTEADSNEVFELLMKYLEANRRSDLEYERGI
jgi:hypothetical protein